MTIMQALVFGGGRFEDVSYLTNETEFDPAGTKPLVTIIPITGAGEYRFPVDPFQFINDLTLDGFLTVEMWGGGGQSGACREGQSGIGGPGGYAKILINTRGLNIWRNGFLNIRVGGGGGQPSAYNVPSDEYVGDAALNIATIQEIASAQISNSVSLGTITPGPQTNSASTRTVSTITPVSTGSISGSATVSLSALLIAGDVIFIASSCDDGTIGALPGYTTLTTRTAPVDAINSLNGPSYRLQYKVVAATDPETTLAQVTGLTATSDTGKSVSHIAYAFRGVDSTFGVYDQGDDVTNLTTYSNSINLPNFNADIGGCTLLSFGYFDNRSTTVTAPTGYTALGPTASSTNSPTGITRRTGITINGVAGDTFIQTLDASNPPDNPPVSFDIGGLSAGDFVLVAACSDGQNPNSFGAGFTEVSDTLNQPNVRYGYTFATGSTVTVVNNNNASGANDNIAYAVLVFTGVDEESPYDVSVVSATGNNPNPNSPEITPITDGCMIVSVASIGNDVITSVGGVTGFTLGPFAATDQGANESSCVMTAFTLQTTAAPIDPPAFTTNGDNVWKSYTFALRPKGIDSTVVSAYRNLTTTSGTNIAGGSFTTTLRGPNAGTSILLRPTETISAAPALIFPAATVGDLIICASVSDGGTMTVPTGFTVIQEDTAGNPSYQLSYKYYDALDVGATINGLSANGTINNNPLDPSLNGRPALARHVAYSFSGVNSGSAIVNGAVSTGTGTNPNPTSFGIPNSSNYASVPFLFISNRSLSTGITPPTTYTLGTIYGAGSDGTGENESTIVNAFKNLPDESEDDPAAFTIPNSPFKTLTIGIEPTATAGSFAGTLPIPGYTSQSEDLIISATVVDTGTPAIPTGFNLISQQNGNQNNPGYQLSYKFTGAGDTQVTGLTPNIGNRGTAHIVRVFRGVETFLTGPGAPTFTTPPSNNGNGNTISYSAVNTYRPDDFVLTFAFVDDKDVTVSSSPVDYSSFIVQSVGTNNNSTENGTIISSYTTTPGSPSETPGDIVISNDDNWGSITIKLSPSIRNKFQNSSGQAYGGSSGGYSALYTPTGELLACVGGGGGGGGGTWAPITATTPVGTIVYNSPLSRGGNGGGGGGCNQNGAPGGEANSFIYTNPALDRTIAGSGGGGGTQIAGGIGGGSYTINPITLLRTDFTQLNPGENGVSINILDSGGRGANSPYNTSDLPLQGANATGGFVQGRGGGASRTNSALFGPTAGRDCGGAGGPGYYGGGGGGCGSRGGGGGGGGGSGYALPGIIVQAASTGIGTVPGGVESAFYGGRVAAGGDSTSGNTVPGTPSTFPFIQGNSGGNGLVVITYQSL